jgi:hypothetical protein
MRRGGSPYLERLVLTLVITQLTLHGTRLGGDTGTAPHRAALRST